MTVLCIQYAYIERQVVLVTWPLGRLATVMRNSGALQYQVLAAREITQNGNTQLAR